MSANETAIRTESDLAKVDLILSNGKARRQPIHELVVALRTVTYRLHRDREFKSHPSLTVGEVIIITIRHWRGHCERSTEEERLINHTP